MTEAVIHRLTQVSSTLDVLHEFAGRGAPHGTVVVAEEQVQGRGTRGRTWQSPPGGLWFSILYRNIEEMAIECLSIRIGLAVANVVESVAPSLRVGLKWPNDLMLDDRKLGGILCEARWRGTVLDWIVVGLGLNVANVIPADLADRAMSLETRVPSLSPGQLVLPLTASLRSLALDHVQLSVAEFSSLSGRDWLQGRVIREPVEGIARGIQVDGSLLVEEPGGNVAVIKAGRVLLD
ncbi:MAG: biotin--[acetyl-CoA-carboxylase] ligase [Gemmatimonadota bacterium]